MTIIVIFRFFRFQVGGTRLAGKIARKEGVAINLGGGFHHCSKDRGGGFCPYADISLVVNEALQENDCKLVMIIDLDAHQVSQNTEKKTISFVSIMWHIFQRVMDTKEILLATQKYLLLMYLIKIYTQRIHMQKLPFQKL